MAEHSRSPRLVKRGDILRTTTTTGAEVEDVVREVQIFVVLGGGGTSQLPIDQDVTILTDDSVSPELIEQIEAMNTPYDPGPEASPPPADKRS